MTLSLWSFQKTNEHCCAIAPLAIIITGKNGRTTNAFAILLLLQWQRRVLIEEGHQFISPRPINEQKSIENWAKSVQLDSS